MADTDTYEALAKMIAQSDLVGQPITPAFLRLLKLQFTSKEAKLALKIGCTGGTLDDLSKKLDMDKDKLLKQIMRMADKGTVRYDPAEENPVYKTVAMTAGGLTETGVWAGIRFPFSIQLMKELYQVAKEHAEGGLVNLGAAFVPVWVGTAVLPEDITPEENLVEVVKSTGHFSVSLCPCRVSRNIVEIDNPCSHMVETCVHTGELSRWTVKHGMARQLSYDELVDLMKKANKDGLVHTINLLGQICNCCNDCCVLFRTHKMNCPTFIPSPFIALSDDKTCNGCGTCEKRCPVNAISVDKSAAVNKELCLGCGVCAAACPTQAIQMKRRL